MKVTKTQSGHSEAASLQTEPAFQPIELKITIESAEELRVLRCITSPCNTHAHAMASYGNLPIEDKFYASSILAMLYNSL